MHRGISCLWMTLLLGSGACSTQTSVRQVLAFHGEGERNVSKVPRSGIYRVQASEPQGRRTTELPHTTVYLREGAPLGFRFDNQRRLVAVGGEYELALNLPSPLAQTIAWYRIVPPNTSTGAVDPFTDAISHPTRTPEETGLQPLVNDPHEFHHK